MSAAGGSAFTRVFWTLLQGISSRVLSLLVFIVLARLLVPADFGLLAMAGVFLALLEIATQRWCAVAMVHRGELEPAHVTTAFWSVVVLGSLAGVGLWLAADSVARFYDTPALGPVVRWLSPILPLRALAVVPAGLLERRFDRQALSVRPITGALAGGAAGIAAALAGWGVYALVVQQLVAAVIGLGVVWAAAAWRPRLSFSFRHLYDLVGLRTHEVGAGILEGIRRRSDDLIIGVFLGDVATGLYAVAYRILHGLTNLVARPETLARVASFHPEEDRSLARLGFYDATRVASVVAMPVFVGLALVAPLLVSLVFGAQYERSGDVLRFLALGGIAHAIGQFSASVYESLGRADVRLRILSVKVLAHAAVILATVRFGIEWVALAASATVYLLVPLDLFALRRLIDVSPKRYFSNFIPAAGACLVMTFAVAAVLVAPVAPWPMLFLSAAVGATSYGVALRLIAPDLARGVASKLRLRPRRRLP